MRAIWGAVKEDNYWHLRRFPKSACVTPVRPAPPPLKGLVADPETGTKP